jgi:predicted DNA-binding protein with PD1-like motif
LISPAKTYKEIEVNEQCEVLSANGDPRSATTTSPAFTFTSVLGLSDGSTRGGHLLKGTVHPTLEVVLTATPAKLRRRMRPPLGIALIDAGPQDR